MKTARAKWRMTLPSVAVSWLSFLDAPWWIAGGWALDLYLGTQTRIHADLDLGIFRCDVCKVLRCLPSWEFFEAHEGVLTRLVAAEDLRPEVHSLWSRPASDVPFILEWLLEESEGDQWIFRRQREISRPLAEIAQRLHGGLPHLAPEIQLLYKSRSPRHWDNDDFERVARLLHDDARAWLRQALERCDPEHPCIAALRE
jgi:Aminoglycoside-2''-adenylyltransferase